ncbi:hypothetical protein JCM10450v2_007915 [Rhodotorula kratochvilovae]
MRAGYGPADPANPENWSLRKKAWVSFCIGFATFAVYIGGGIVSTGYQSMIDEFGVTHQAVSTSMSLYIFAYGAGALVFSPLSEMHQLGRNPPYYIPLLFAVALQLGAALTPTFAGLAVLRLLIGFFVSPLLATGGASIADIWGLRRFPVALCFVWVLPGFCAPGLAPILTVYAVERFGWRWSMWIQLWFLAAAAVLILLSPETFEDNILYRRACRLRRLTGDTKLKTRAEVLGAGKNATALLYEALAVPFKVTLLDPSILFANLYIGLCYGIFFSFFEAFPIVFAETYFFTASQQALAFLCVNVGAFVGAAVYIAYQLFYMFPLVARKGMPVVERRLEPALVSSITAAIGLFIFAWSSYRECHWSGPLFGTALYVASNINTFQCVFYYIILAYPKYAASVLAANDFIRSSIAAGLLHGATPLFRSRAGIHGGVSLLGGLAACGIVGIWVLYLQGASLRAKSRFTGGGRAADTKEQNGVVEEELVEDLASLRLSRSPVRIPFPRNFDSPPTQSDSSTKQRFVRRGELRYIIYTPELDEEVWTAFVDELVERIPAGDEGKGLSAAAKASVEGAIRTFEKYRFVGYEEASIRSALRPLFSSLDAIIPEIDAAIGFPHEGFTDALVDVEKLIPKVDVRGRPVDYSGSIDLAFYRAEPEPGDDDEEILPAAAGFRSVLAVEVETPDASRDHDSHPHAGLFVRLARDAASLQVFTPEDLPQPRQRSLMKKAIIAARTYGHDFLIFEDGYSFMLALLVEHPAGRYDVLLSKLKRISDAHYFGIHIVPFYSKVFVLARRFVEFANSAAASYGGNGLRTMPPAEEETSRRESSGACDANVSADESRGYMPDIAADAMERAGEGARGRAAGDALSSFRRLADLLSDTITIEYPDGTPYSAALVLCPANSLASSTSSRDSDPAALPEPVNAPNPRRLDRIHLRRLIGEGVSARVYDFESFGRRYVLKIALREHAQDLEDEIRHISGRLRCVEENAIPLEAVFRRSDGRPGTLMRYAGVALESWTDLALEQRVSLVVSLLRIHQRAGILHGDAAPRNAVLPAANSPTETDEMRAPALPPRWIDWVNAEQHPHCDGRRCPEIVELVAEMRLGDDGVERVARAAEERGLAW